MATGRPNVETFGNNLRTQLPKAQDVTNDIVKPVIDGGADPFLTVNQPTKAFEELNKVWNKTRSLMGGTEAMRDQEEKYLPREPAETRKSYENRLARSVLFNAYRETIETSTGRPFSKPIQFENFGSRFLELNENIDLQGNNIDVFARNWFKTALAHSNAYVIIDYPKRPDIEGRADEPPSLEDERVLGLRPYWRIVEPYRVIGWRAVIVGGVVIPIQIRIREKADVFVGLFDTIEVERVRVLEPGSFQLYQKDPTSGRWGLEDSGVFLDAQGKQLDFIPIVNFVIGEEIGFMQARPKFEDLADLNILHWQSQSDQQNILHVARVPILFGSGFHDEDDIEIGSSRWIKGPEGSDLKYVEHSGAAIEAGRQSIEDLENQMRIMGAEILVRDPAKVTATQKVLDTDEALSDLENGVVRFEDAMAQAYDLTNRWLGDSPDAVGEIDIFKDFGISAQAFEETQILLQTRLAKQITQETFLMELKRRGLIGDDVDVPVEVQLTANEISDDMIDDIDEVDVEES